MFAGRSLARAQLTHRSANPAAEEGAQRHPICIANLDSDQINAVIACLQEVYRALDTQILEIGEWRLAQHVLQAAGEGSLFADDAGRSAHLAGGTNGQRRRVAGRTAADRAGGCARCQTAALKLLPICQEDIRKAKNKKPHRDTRPSVAQDQSPIKQSCGGA